MSDTTWHQNGVALERLHKFALQNRLIDKPLSGVLEKHRAGRRDRLPKMVETEAILGTGLC